MKNFIIYNQSNMSAFTLLEMVVAIILSFFVFGIIFLIYGLINQHLIKEYESPLSTLLLLKSEIEMDFFHAEKIIVEKNQLYILKDNRQTSYLIQDDILLKNSDTLYIGLLQKNIKIVEGMNWVKQLDLFIKEGDEEFKLTFRKKYLPNFKLKDKELNFEY